MTACEWREAVMDPMLRGRERAHRRRTDPEYREAERRAIREWNHWPSARQALIPWTALIPKCLENVRAGRLFVDLGGEA